MARAESGDARFAIFGDARTPPGDQRFKILLVAQQRHTVPRHGLARIDNPALATAAHGETFGMLFDQRVMQIECIGIQIGKQRQSAYPARRGQRLQRSVAGHFGVCRCEKHAVEAERCGTVQFARDRFPGRVWTDMENSG